MKKSLLIIGALVIVGIFAIVAYVLRPPAEATAPIEAIPLATATAASVAQEPGQTGAYPAPAQEAIQTEEAYPAPEEAAGQVVFSIVQEESRVRFTLNEELRGAPTTAVGTTNQFAGEVLIDFNNPANSQLGIIQVNARTLATDNDNRNRMIRNEILDTAAYEFITFTPTAITGLPESIAMGDTVTFQITGNLTIREITQSVTFEAAVTVVSTDRLEGLASVTLLRSDYDLVIPSVPSVANVSEEVLVEIQFVAVP